MCTLWDAGYSFTAKKVQLYIKSDTCKDRSVTIKSSVYFPVRLAEVKPLTEVERLTSIIDTEVENCSCLAQLGL